MSAADVTPEEIKELRERFTPFRCDLQTSRDVRRILDALEAAQAERDQLRAELETARAALVEQIEARQVTEAEGGALQQANNEIDRLQAELSRLRDDVQRGSDRERDLAVLLADRTDERDHAVRQGVEAVLERDSLRLEVDALRSAPVAVEVPELTKQQIAMAEACCDEDDYPPFEEWALNGKLGDLADIVATLYKARSNAIDSSRILKDGERAVTVEEWERLKRNHIRRMIDSRTEAETRAWQTFRASDRNLELGAASPRSHEIGNRLDRFVTRCFAALCSGEAEGRKG